MKENVVEKEKKSHQGNTFDDVYFARRVKAFISFMNHTIAQEDTERRMKIKFMLIVGSEERITCTAKHSKK